MEELLTVKELSQRWNCTEQSLRKQLNEGNLKAINIPGAGLRFSIEYIRSIEERTDEITVRKYKDLLRKYNELEKKHKQLLEIVGNILSETAKITKV